jgi:anti-sigma factor RsiW
MKQAEYIDDLMINAFVDGQLDVANCGAVLAAMEADPETRHRVYLVRRAKDLMRVGFGTAQALSPTRSGRKKSWFGERRGYGLAASLVMLSLGFGSGALGYYVSTQLSHGENKVALASRQASDTDHVILHIYQG